MLEETDVVSELSSRFQLLDQLGRGTMATVYRARSLERNDEVAIKIVDLRDARFDPNEREEQQRRFHQEAEAQQQLSHPNVVRVYDHGFTERHLYLVMEHVSGGTLADRLKNGPMPPLDAIKIARQVAHGLGAAHELGFVHRDLKPANILLEESGGSTIAKITDFGLVKDLTDQVSATKTGQMLGTPMYMAPEQIRGEAVDVRCDLYAFGVLLYRMLAGRPPFEETQTAAVLVAHLNQEPLPLDTPLPDTVVSTLARCLAKDREDRFANSAELEQALDRCHRVLLSPELDDTLRHAITRPPFDAQPPTRRFGLVVGLLLLGVAAAGLMLAFWAWPTPDPLPTAPAPVERPVPAPAPVAPPEPPEAAPDAPVVPAPPIEPVPVKPVVRPTPRPAPTPNPAPAPTQPAPTEPPPPAPAPAPAPDLRIRQTDLKNPFAR